MIKTNPFLLFLWPTLLLSILSLNFVGCQSKPKYSWTSNDLLIDDKTSLDAPKKPLTIEQIEKDKSLLLYALINGYGGRNYIPDNKMQIAINEIERISGSMTAEEFRDKVDETLLIIPDNHLVARANGSASRVRQNSYKKGLVGENAISDKNKVWEAERRSYNGRKYLYVSITKFPSHKDKVWNGFISQTRRSMNKTSFAVIDLRGNGGGDDTMGFSLAELLNGAPIKNPMSRQFISQTPETLAIFMNNFKLREIRIKNKGETPPSYFEQLRSEKEKEYNMAMRGELPSEKTEGDKVDQITQITHVTTTINQAYGKPIYLLFDGKCGSSCESTIDAFEFVPNTTRVGQNTAGFIHFGNIGYVVLPESKIEVQIPTHYNEFFDGRFLERVGIKPDIYVPDNQNALNFTLDKIVD